MRGVSIQYGDVAPEAKENFVPSVSEKPSFVDLTQLQRYNVDFLNYGNPCEKYSVVLDGSVLPFPSNPNGKNLGWWSEQISNEDGYFGTPIELVLVADGQYSSQGITFTFDKDKDIYCTHLKIKWVRVTDETTETISEMEFYPDSAFYFCQNKVENYTKLVVTFYRMNMPKNRLKLHAIDYGYGTVFYGDELRSVKCIQEIDPISSEISINVTDFTLDSKRNIEYSFQAKQPITTRFGERLISTTFVKNAKRTARRMWTVQTEDYISMMANVPFFGGIYNNEDAVELMKSIFTAAKVPYSIEGISGTVTGYIPFTDCREALKQVAFAVGAVVDTSGLDVVKVYKLNNEITQTIPLTRIMQGQSFDDGETITSVEVVAHSFIPTEEELEAYTTEQAAENAFITFSEPLHDLSITNGTILEYGANYAVINADDGCVLKGKKYNHLKNTASKRNPLVLASELEKVASIASATLVSGNNVDQVLERCYAWLTRTNKTTLKVIEGKKVVGGGFLFYGRGHKYGTGLKYGGAAPKTIIYDMPINVGDMIGAETEYLGTVEGRLIKQTFNLNSGILIKDGVIK